MNYLLSGAGDIIITDNSPQIPLAPTVEVVRAIYPSESIDMTRTAAGEALIGAYVKKYQNETVKPAVVHAVQKSQFSSSALGVFVDMYKRMYPKDSDDQIMARVNTWIKKNPLANDETLMALVATSYDTKKSILVPALLAMGAAAYFLLS